MTNQQQPMEVKQNVSNVATGGTVIGVQYVGLTTEEVEKMFLTLQREDQPKVWNGRSPYPGLAAFRERDAPFFFGRQALINELIGRVEAGNFITIAGPSGSGKSSVARAGLFSALRQGRINKSEGWLLATMQPRSNPFEQLAVALERATKSTEIGDAMRQDKAQLQRQIEMYLTDDNAQRFVLLVDQFEELFTQTKDTQVQASFIELLTTAVSTPNSRITIILSLRSDFISRCASYPDLRSLMSQQFQLVGAMTPQELVEAITLPALRVGAVIDPDLVSRVIADMRGEPGALPLMSFALRELFEQEKTAEGEPMDMKLPEYLAVGGLESALERHAQTVFDDFTDEQRELAKSIFSKLIQVGQGRMDTRRTASFAELIPADVGAMATMSVVSALSQERARLLTLSGGDFAAATKNPATVTIAHDKLIDAWPWLRELVDENRQTIALQNEIYDAARKWEKEQDIGFLYRGGQLLQVKERLEVLTPSLDKLSAAFIQASIDQQEQEITAKEAQQKHALEQAQRIAEEQRQRAEAEQKRSYLLRRVLMVGAVLVLVLGFAVSMARTAQTKADSAAKAANENLATAVAARLEAEAARSTADAANVRAADNAARAEANEAIAVAEAARAEKNEARALAEAALARESEARAVAARLEAEAANQRADESDDIAQSSQKDALRNRQLAEAQDLAERAEEAIVQNSSAEAYLRALQALDRYEDENNLPVVKAQTALASALNELPARAILTIQEQSDDAIRTVAFNHDGSRILTVSAEGAARLWNGEGSFLTLLEGEVVSSAIFSPDGSYIATTTADGRAWLWDGAGQAAVEFDGHTGVVNTVAFNHDGSRIVTASKDSTAMLWDGEGQFIRAFREQGGEITSAIFSPDGRIATTSTNGKVWLQHQNGGVLNPFRRNKAGERTIPIETIVFNSDSSRLLTIGTDGKVWVRTGISGYITEIPLSQVTNAIFSPDGNRILTVSNGNVQLHNSNGILQTTLNEPAGLVTTAVFNHDGSRIAVARKDGLVRLWSNTGQLIATFKGHTEAVTSVAFSRDGQQIATGSEDGTVRLWAEPGAFLYKIERNVESLNEAGFAGAELLNETVAAESQENALLIQNSEFTEPSNSITVSYDGSKTVTTHNNGTAYLWNEADQIMAVLRKHTAAVNEASFNHDGSRIVTVSSDGTAWLWDGAGRPIVALEGHGARVMAAGFNEDGSQLVTLSSDGIARVWNVAPFSSIEAMRGEVVERLSSFLLDPDCLADSDAADCELGLVQGEVAIR